MSRKNSSTIIKFTVPNELLEFIDQAASSQYQTRSEYCRNTLVNRLMKNEQRAMEVQKNADKS